MVGGNYPGGGGNYLGGIIIQWEIVRGAIFLWGSCPGTIINDHYRFLWKYNARTIFVIKKPILLLRLKIELLFPSAAMKLVIWEWIFPEHFAAVSNLKSSFSLDGLSFLPKFFVDCMDSREFHYYKTIVDPSYCFKIPLTVSLIILWTLTTENLLVQNLLYVTWNSLQWYEFFFSSCLTLFPDGLASDFCKCFINCYPRCMWPVPG